MVLWRAVLGASRATSMAVGWVLLKVPFLRGAVAHIQGGEEIVRVDPEEGSFAWEGWGTSLAWWANFAGGLPQEDLDWVLDLFFDAEKGLGLNIVRYNIGGGANLDFDSNMRKWADVPGFKPSATGPYDWDADPRQRAVLLGAQARGVDIFEAFSNSPPPWMTTSGSVTGANNGGDNLRPECYGAFAEYLAKAVATYSSKYGVVFRTLEPFNEPLEGFWKFKAHGGQEGCGFLTSSIGALIPLVKRALEENGAEETKLAVADTWGKNTKRMLDGLGPEVLAHVDQINVHTYFNIAQFEARRTEVRDSVKALGKKLWMSEHGPQSMWGGQYSVALQMALHITKDINELNPAAWVYWQVLEAPGTEWGLVQMPLELGLGPTHKVADIRKQYYVMMQFCKWIRPGSRILLSGGKDYSVVAYDKERHRLTIVVTNWSRNERKIVYDLSPFMPFKMHWDITVTRTSATENHVVVDHYSKPNSVVALLAPTITVTAAAASVTTFVVENAEWGLRSFI